MIVNKWRNAASLAAACVLLYGVLPAHAQEAVENVTESAEPAKQASDNIQPIAKLQAYPTRIMLKPGQTTAEINVINPGIATGRYRLTMADMKMPEEGALQRQKDEEFGPYSLGSYLRATPRTVTVPSGQSQKFRLIARLPRDLAPGEYNTHAHIVMTSDNVESESATSPEPGAFAAGIKPHFRVSVPVKVIIGDPTFTATIDGVEFLPADANRRDSAVKVSFSNSGDRAAMGDLVITLEKGGQVYEVNRVNSYTIYRGTPKRKTLHSLQLPEGVTLQGGVLKVTYSHTKDAGGAVISEKTLAL